MSSSQIHHYTLLSKNVLTPEEAELYELGQLGGIIMDPNVYKIILDLLKLNVAPTAILHMLKSMCEPRKKKPSSDGYDQIRGQSSRSSLQSGHRRKQDSRARSIETRR